MEMFSTYAMIAAIIYKANSLTANRMKEKQIMKAKTGREDITLEDMRAEIVREVVTRKRVYPRWIAEGKISEDVAHYRMIVYEALMFHLHEEVEKNGKPDEKCQPVQQKDGKE